MIADFVKWLVYFVGAFALLLFLVIFFQRLISTTGEGRRNRKREAMLPVFKAYLIEDTTLAELCDIARRSLPEAERIVLDYLRELTGTSRDRLLQAAHTLGLIDRAIQDLYSWNWTVRDLAAMRLGVYSLPESVSDLVKRLHDQRLEVRYTAARSLGTIGSPQAIEALVEILDQPHLLDTPRVLEIVQSMEGQMNEPLRRLLESPEHHPAAKLLAIDLVGDLRDYSMLDTLHQILHSSDKEKVVRAVKAIGKIAAPHSIEEILFLARDRAWEVRAQALKAIGLLKIDEGLQLLIEGLGDRAYWVRRNAADALVSFGDKGYAALLEARQSEDTFARDIASYELERMGRLPEEHTPEPEEVEPVIETPVIRRPFLPAGGTA